MNEELTPEQIHTADLAEVMKNYRPVYPTPYTWETTFAYMLRTPHDKKIVDVLINEVQKDENNLFRDPIILHDDDESPDDDFMPDSKTILDGTHRICAAYLAGVEKILVSDGYSELSDNIDEYLIITEITAKNNSIVFTNDEIDIIIDATRSIPLTNDQWIVQSMSFVQDNNCNISWDRYDKNIKLDEITQKIVENLNDVMPHIPFHVKTFVEVLNEDLIEENEMWDNA